MFRRCLWSYGVASCTHAIHLVWRRFSFDFCGCCCCCGCECVNTFLVKVECHLFWFFINFSHSPFDRHFVLIALCWSLNVNYGLLNSNLIANESIMRWLYFMWRQRRQRRRFRFAFNIVIRWFIDAFYRFHFIYFFDAHANWNCVNGWTVADVLRNIVCILNVRSAF